MSPAERNLIVGATAAFLQRYAPFDQMQMEAVREFASQLELAYFSKGRAILGPEDGAPLALHIVQRGRVESRRGDADGGYSSVRTLGVGEMFPLGASMGRRASHNRYTACADTFCYLLPAERFNEWIEREPVFRRFCTDQLSMLLAQTERARSAEYSEVLTAQQALSAPLRKTMVSNVETCAPMTPIRTALSRMAERKVGCMLIVEDNAPIGILTERDVLGRIALAGVALDAPIDSVMTPRPITLRADNTAYDAAAAMVQHGVRHIPVLENGRLAGIVSERDLFGLQRGGLHHVGRAIDAAISVDALVSAAREVAGLIGRLLAQGTAGEPLTKLISALNDRIVRRAITLTMAEHPLDDVEFCWLALGSEGREEQTLSTDQDNAIAFQPRDGQSVDALRTRLLAFGNAVNAALARCGFPLCQGNIMAGQPDCCLSVDEWRARFIAWVRTPTPQALLNAAIFFDFRPLFGAEQLVQPLRDLIGELAREQSVFLRHMAANALEVEPPLGLLRDFATELGGEHVGTIDLKAGAIRIFVDAARIFALARGIPYTSTAARLRAYADTRKATLRETHALIDGFYFLQMLRLKNQRSNVGSSAPNRIAPSNLNDLERRVLKETLRLAKELQQFLALEYRL